MRKLFCTFIISAFLLSCQAQPPQNVKTDTTTNYSEFDKNTNGLIYSDNDISALRFVVDSLNLKFKTCDLNKVYLSYPQTKLYTISFKSKTNNLLEIKKEFEGNPDFYTLIKKYKAFLNTVDSNRLLIKSPYKQEDGKTAYLSGNAFGGFEKEYSISRNKIEPGQKWVYDYEKKGEYNDAYSIDCYFMPNDFFQIQIPSKYAKLIQYIDCMIDTSATIFLGKKEADLFGRSTSKKATAYYNDINGYLTKKMDLKNKKDDYTFDYLSDIKIAYAKNNLQNDVFLLNKLQLLSAAYLDSETGNDAAEELIAAFVSKAKALEIKRKRRVYGQCSMDNSPRVHAKNIASLAAETHSWDIFLRAHLNIMNDRFDRMSDGSYAWGQRQTYIKELEVLDINVADMMLGLSLRAYNVAEEHYNGTIWRIGKALCESKDRLKFEEEAKNIMKDNNLDQFNRSLIFLLYHTYLNYLEDKAERKLKVQEFKKTVSQYPSFLQSVIGEMKETLAD